jgi:hypothetical protein
MLENYVLIETQKICKKYIYMYNDFIDKCKLLLKRPDVQDELRSLVRPMLDYIMIVITPYIYISLILVVVSFLLILGIFILLLRGNQFNK